MTFVATVIVAYQLFPLFLMVVGALVTLVGVFVLLDRIARR